MNTPEIAKSLAITAAKFPFLGSITEQDLLDLVKLELGHEAILDGFQPYGGQRAMAFGPSSILHVISGNTPHAGLQSLIRGLLLKSHNFCKIPSQGLPEIEQFRNALPRDFHSCVEISQELPDQWLEQSEAVIVFGDDEAVEHFRRHVRPDQRFVAHGHKISFGIVFEDPGLESAVHAARDSSLFDQQGCLSPHVFYVDESGGLDARRYAAALACEMEKFNQTSPRAKIGTGESAAINGIRSGYEFRAANHEPVEVWKSMPGTDWTVIFDANPLFVASCLNRVIYVKPLPPKIEETFPPGRGHLSTVAIWPASLENAKLIGSLGGTRICRIGRMQSPHFSWHQDGGQNLAPLVRWIDFEESAETAAEKVNIASASPRRS